jgi:hypothetical protein
MSQETNEELIRTGFMRYWQLPICWFLSASRTSSHSSDMFDPPSHCCDIWERVYLQA